MGGILASGEDELNAFLSPYVLFATFAISAVKRGLDSNDFYVLPAKEERFPSTTPPTPRTMMCRPLRRSSYLQEERKNDQSLILPTINADHDVVISWWRKPPGRLGITRS